MQRTVIPWLVILFLGFVFTLFGLYSFVRPEGLADLVGLSFDAVGATDVRATYGGVQTGFGLYLLWSAADRLRFRAALITTAFLIGAIGACRAAAPLLGGGWSRFHTVAVLFELATAGLCLVLARNDWSPRQLT